MSYSLRDLRFAESPPHLKGLKLLVLSFQVEILEFMPSKVKKSVLYLKENRS